MVPARVARGVEGGPYHSQRAAASGSGVGNLGTPVEWKVSEVSV